MILCVILLLNVIYKLASGVIAQTPKKTLNCIISDCQTGFNKGRLISELTRLIYDLKHTAENKNKIGLLMLTSKKLLTPLLGSSYTKYSNILDTVKTS